MLQWPAIHNHPSGAKLCVSVTSNAGEQSPMRVSRRSLLAASNKTSSQPRMRFRLCAVCPSITKTRLPHSYAGITPTFSIKCHQVELFAVGEGEAEQAGVKGQTGGAWLGAGPVSQVQAGSPAAETNNSGLKRDHCGIQRFNVQARAKKKKKM